MPQQQEDKTTAKQTKKTVRQPGPPTEGSAPSSDKAGKSGAAKTKLNGNAPITNIAELQAVLDGDAASVSPGGSEPAGKAGGKKVGRKDKLAVEVLEAGQAQSSIGEEGGKKGRKGKKEKVIRDSFTMPRNDYDKIAELKKRIQHLGMSAKKSEVLRAGLHALEHLSDTQLKQMIEGVEKIKTGRPG